MRENISSIGPTRKLLMFQEERMLKDKLLSSIRSTMEPIRDGRLSILIKPIRLLIKDLSRNLDSMPTDHSTLFQDSQ
jgi:hypothetical protein